MSYTDEREQVMLTYRLHRDRTGDDQLVISAVVGEGSQVEGARAEHLGVRARHPSRGGGQALGVKVHPERDQECGCSLLCGGQINSARRPHHPQRRSGHDLRCAGIIVESVRSKHPGSHGASPSEMSGVRGRKACGRRAWAARSCRLWLRGGAAVGSVCDFIVESSSKGQ